MNRYSGLGTKQPLTQMLRVMLVDDSYKEFELLNDALDAAGYDVFVEPGSSARALPERVAALRPDVIIIGADSPTRDTIEQLFVVTEHNPRPIVLFTDERSNETIQAALRAGVSAYIVAGLAEDSLQPILDVALARFEQDRALRAELDDARTKLVERKAIERAKGVVMKTKGVSEEEAYDARRGIARRIRLRDGRIRAVRLSGDASAEPWLREFMARGQDVTALRARLLTASSTPPGDYRPRGRIVCTCFDVAEDAIAATLAALPTEAPGALACLQTTLKCGTQCGSCLPELRKLATRQAVTA